jgi:hypothetical protein
MARQNVRNSSDILRLLNRIINLLENDEIDEKKARAMIYACSTAGSIIKTLELETRLEELERKAG